MLRNAPPGHEQRGVFLRLWTLKEAYIKAHGDGLSLPLDRFAFSLSPPIIVFAPGFPDDPAVWQFSTLTPTSSHILSVAVLATAAARIPLQSAPHLVTHPTSTGC